MTRLLARPQWSQRTGAPRICRTGQ